MHRAHRMGRRLKTSWRTAYYVLFAIWAAAGTGTAARTPGAAPAGAPADPPAEQVFKNIQVLKGMPASQLRPAMNLISSSLGVHCDQCHVQGAFEKDDKRPKQTARKMIQMVLDVNKNAFEGETQVSCFTCHRGKERPVAIPPIGEETAQAPGPRSTNADLPTFDQIAEKYVQAAGGSGAFENLKTRIMKGTMSDTRGDSAEVEVDQAAPGKIVTVVKFPNGAVSQGYNGTVAWAKTPAGQADISGQELAQLKRSADLARPLKIREECLSPRVMAKTELDGVEAYVVTGRADGQRVQLYFDAGNGLLLRRRIMINTVLGAFPEQDDYSDYRKVDGVTLPFVVRHSTPESFPGTTFRFTEITHNVPVDESRFNPPAGQK